MANLGDVVFIVDGEVAVCAREESGKFSPPSIFVGDIVNAGADPLVLLSTPWLPVPNGLNVESIVRVLENGVDYRRIELYGLQIVRPLSELEELAKIG